MINRDHITLTFFLALAALVVYLFAKIVLPFVAPLIWAAVAALVMYPLHRRLTTRFKERKRLSALIITLAVLVLLIGPMTFFAATLVSQAGEVVARVNTLAQTGELQKLWDIRLPVIDSIKEWLSQYYDFSQVNPDQIVKGLIDRVGALVIDQIGWLIANGAKAVFYFILMLLATYYFLIDGDSLVKRIRDLLPMPRAHIEQARRQLKDVVIATIYSGLAVAALQGLIGGILFASVGIPSALFWGAIMGFLALLPVIGAFIVYIPAAIVLIAQGAVVKGIIVLAIGVGLISQIDNFLRPMLMAGRTALHPLLLFVSIMGGVAAFGFTGMVLGPAVSALFLSLMTMVGERSKD
ncbi:MAG: AI-2E family transporter [candidate division Zixibacteria bacterium]|nr:AI-2E family transporter [candidate division Zixibacteria bacterium]